MEKVHKVLTEKFSWYARWHGHENCHHAHWVFFSLAVLLPTVGVLLGIQDYKAQLQALLADTIPMPGPEARIRHGRVGDAFHNRILVKFKSGVSEQARGALFSRHTLREQDAIPELGIQVVTIHSQKDALSVVRELTAKEAQHIEFTEIDALLAPAAVPNDPWFANWQKNKQLIGLPSAWDTATGAPNLSVAVVDTGVDCMHEDIVGKCLEDWNFYDGTANAMDVNGHGTKVAGVIGAQGNNGIGVAGSAWDIKIFPLRVSDASGYASYSAIAKAITYAADHGARVANVSYQASGSRAVRSAGSYMRKKGGLITVSAGNSGSPTGNTASGDLVVVSATDPNDAAYIWSNFGNDVDIAAPGCTGATTLLNGGYGSFCGTSHAAPEVAGVLALIWSVNPELTSDQAQSILFTSAADMGVFGWDATYGWGRMDANAAAAKALVTPADSASLQNKGRKK